MGDDLPGSGLVVLAVVGVPRTVSGYGTGGLALPPQCQPPRFPSRCRRFVA